MNIIFKTKFGSHLYGTATEKSDTDYKGIYLPTIEDCILQRISKSVNNNTKKNSEHKNSAEDIDIEIYSLQYFLELAYKGETVAIDMLHANKENVEIQTPISNFLWKNRSKFYTKNLKAYVGYCRTQAAKYGIKGSRLADAKKVIDYLLGFDLAPNVKIEDTFDNFPKGEHINMIEFKDVHQADKRGVEICNRKIMAGTRVRYAIDIIIQFYNSYGERAKKAERNEGIDWKAISHAFRAGFQLVEIYETGDLVYPLKEAKLLRDIKQGKLHYVKDNLGQELEDLIDRIEVLAYNSGYPEKVDRKFFEDWLISLYK